MTKGTMISYAHRANPDGQRFCQYDTSPVPSWAVDVRNEAEEAVSETDPETDRILALREYLKQSSNHFWGDGTNPFDDVLDKMDELGL